MKTELLEKTPIKFFNHFENQPGLGLSQWSLAQLLSYGYDLKQSQDNGKKALSQIHQELERCTVFPSDKATGHLQAGGYKARITRKENIKYDQEKLLEIKQRMPAMFNQVFKIKYDPEAAALKTFMAADKEFAQAIIWARSVTPAAPAITYEKAEN